MQKLIVALMLSVASFHMYGQEIEDNVYVHGDWIVEISNQNVTESFLFTPLLTKTVSVFSVYWDGRSHNRIEFRCLNGQMDLLILWGTTTVSPAVTYRYDGGWSITENWRLSANNTATFYEGDVQQLILEILSAIELGGLDGLGSSFAAWVFSESSDEIRFADWELYGFSAAIAHLIEACN